MTSTEGSCFECSESKHFKAKGWMYLQVTARFHHSSPAHWEAIPRVHGIITVADGGLDGAAILERAIRNGRGPALLTRVDQGPSYKDHQRSVSWQFQAYLWIHSFFFLGTNGGRRGDVSFSFLSGALPSVSLQVSLVQEALHCCRGWIHQDRDARLRAWEPRRIRAPRNGS